MYQTVRQQTRPNTSVEFYSPENSANITQEMKRHLFTTYVRTGKQIDVVKSISEDGLTQTITILWDSQASQEAYSNDSTVKIIVEDSETYRIANGIDMQVIGRGEV